MNRNVFRIVLLCVVAASVCSTAMAAAVNVDFGITGESASGVYIGTAAAPDAGTTWNGVAAAAPLVYVESPYTSGALLNSLGGATTVTVTVQPVFWGYDGAADSLIAPGLMHDYIFTPSAGGASAFTFSIDGLTPGGMYDLYLYSSTGAQQSTFDVGGVLKSVVNTTASTAFVVGDNYQLYSGLTATGGSISVSVTGSPGPYYGVLNGFQLVPVPEPSMLAMFAAGLFGMVVYAWRKRK